MAATQIVYAMLLAYALTGLVEASGIVGSTRADTESIGAALDGFGRFRRIWDFAFFFFSLHLILLGWLVHDDDLLRRVLATLLLIAGLGYFADSAIAFSMPMVTFRFAPFTFFGEMAFMIWLFVRGGKPARRA
jgi:hypothetical protein